MDQDSELVENIKACRTCGIHYVTPSKYQLKHLFQSPLEHSEIMLIRLELAKWNVEVAENDGYPQYVCNSCIHKFEQVFELRAACINAQNEFRKFYNVPNGNLANIKIKTEKDDEDEEQQICDFIYVDDLSDTEYDCATPFNIPHVPIKEEFIEAATIPMEESVQSTNLVESTSNALTDPTSTPIPLTQKPQNERSPVQMSGDQVECKLCQHLSHNQEDHKQHLQRAHEIRDMECHICGKEFKNSNPARLKFHMKWHTLNKHVKCTLCGFVCNSKEALKEHKHANHGKIKCKICGKGVLAKKMKFHLRKHELLPKYSCEYCMEVYTTEDERENHIWQVHANEDCNISNSQNSGTAETNINVLEQQQDILHLDPQNDTLIYKFLCAHCSQRFMEQIDLETHVKKEHLACVGAATSAMTQLATEDDEHANITVFENYDNDEEIHVPADNNALANDAPVVSDFLQPISSPLHFESQTEDMESGDKEQTIHPYATDDYSTETFDNFSTQDHEGTDLNYDDECNISTAYTESNLNTFACAKCTETFITIEQLRNHYKQHITGDNLPLKVSPRKSKFKCNLCEKYFDLKFSLNRHVKKHKHAPV